MKKRVSHDIPIEEETPKPDGPAEARADSGEPAFREAVDQLQRLQAEFANYRKRIERERLETVEFAQHALIEKLVPVLDDFDRALATLDETSSPAAKGLTLIREKLSKVLTDAGLKRIETRDATFDPHLHEALTTQPVEVDRAERILEELVAGYTFRDRLVRPARVCVGVEAPKAGDDPAG